MATARQKKVARLIIENARLDKPLNAGQMLEKVSYSKGMQQQPSRILNSEGVQEELKSLGFTEDGAKTVVQSIMYDESADPNARLKATDQVFKVSGSYAPEKNVNINVELEANAEVKKIAEEINALHRGTNQPGDGIDASALDQEVSN